MVLHGVLHKTHAHGKPGRTPRGAHRERAPPRRRLMGEVLQRRGPSQLLCLVCGKNLPLKRQRIPALADPLGY